MSQFNKGGKCGPIGGITQSVLEKYEELLNVEFQDVSLLFSVPIIMINIL